MNQSVVVLEKVLCDWSLGTEDIISPVFVLGSVYPEWFCSYEILQCKKFIDTHAFENRCYKYFPHYLLLALPLPLVKYNLEDNCGSGIWNSPLFINFCLVGAATKLIDSQES